MDNKLEFETLRIAIMEDFIKTSGYIFESQKSSSKDFVFQIDPMFLLNLIVTPIVKQIVEYVGKKVSDRKDNYPALTEGEIKEIRKLVHDFEHNTGMSRNSLFTPELADKMANSIERVLRQNPRALIRTKGK